MGYMKISGSDGSLVSRPVKKGAKGAPTDAAFRRAAKTAKKKIRVNSLPL